MKTDSQTPEEGIAIHTWAEHAEIVLIQAVNAFGVAWLVTCIVKWLACIWFMHGKLKLMRTYVNVSREISWQKGAILLCIDDCVKPLDTGPQQTTWTIFAEESILQELKFNPSTSTQVLPQEPIFPNLPSRVLCMMMRCILFIYNSRFHYRYANK